MARRNFSGLTSLTYQESANAARAQTINDLLDDGVRVFGDDGPDAESTWHELVEALTPRCDGIDCRTIDGTIVRIYAYSAKPERAAAYDALKAKTVVG